MESSNKKFLAPAAVSAGEFSGNVYRLTEEFTKGKGKKKEKKKKSTNHTRAPCYSPAVSKCKIKKKTQNPKPKQNKKRRFQICSAPHPLLQKKKKKKSLGKSACSSQFQPAKVSRLIAILGLRKLLKRDLIASNVQKKWGVRVSVSFRAWLALARARSPRLPPSLLQRRLGVAARSGSSLSLVSIYCLLFCPSQLGEGPGAERAWIGRPSLRRLIHSLSGQQPR